MFQPFQNLTTGIKFHLRRKICRIQVFYFLPFLKYTKPKTMKYLKTTLPALAFLLLLNSPASAIVPATVPNDDPTTTIVNGIKEFKSLPRSERKARLKELRKTLREWRANRRAGKESDNQILAIIFAILIPPLGVFIYQQRITTKFWISLLLTLLFWLPGAIYSLLVVTGNA